MSSALVTEVSGPFLVMPASSGQPISYALQPIQKSWAQQQIEKQGSSNTQEWLPSTDPIKIPNQMSMKLGDMGTLEMLPVTQQTPQTAKTVATTTPASTTTQSSTDIQAALQSGKVNVLEDGIYETEATAFGFANTQTTPAASYLVYGIIALASLALVYYLYQNEYF
ncbi:hypothetical protein M0R72_05850 [Candidatus Pacearchaeota archaeon]|jgi:hypothetical protein|nr:hypothetical protein [Candidatus Pacearchaeota archaeon]